MSEIELMSMGEQDGKTGVIFTIIATLTCIALHVFYILPYAWKKADFRTVIFQSSTEVDIPPYVGFAVFVHNSLNFFSLLTMDAKFTKIPLHYICLFISSAVVAFSSAIYTVCFITCRDKRRIPASWLMPMWAVLMVSAFFVAYNARNPGMFELIGLPATISGIIMYAAPLPLVMKSRKLETIQYFQLWLSIAYFINAFSWVIVALQASYFEPYFFVTNGVGTLFGLIHLRVISSSTWSPEIPRTQEGWWVFLIQIRRACHLSKVDCMEEVSRV